MKSKFAFEKMTLPVLTLCLLFVFSACGGGKTVKPAPVAKGSGMTEAREVKQTPQSVQKETQTEKARDGRFIAYHNGTVLDTRTGLIWAAEDNGSNINWVNAKFYCENYRGAGYSDWRMPTQEELAGLYDAAKTYKSACGVEVHLTKLIRITCIAPWASETRNLTAASFIFDDGIRYWGHQQIGGGRALPVRSVK
jgi:hypothetical protein